MSPLAGISASVITVSDRVSRSEANDLSGPAIVEMLSAAGAEIIESIVLPDEREEIADQIRRSAGVSDLVITTGGTGLGPRDVTPEATLEACERQVPGMVQVMLAVSLKKTPFAALSRAVAGTCGDALVINLPGSPGGVRDCLEAILDLIPHAVRLMHDEPTTHIQT